jgi:hypothetical protein
MKTPNIYLYILMLICLSSCFEQEIDLVFTQIDQKIIITAWLDDTDMAQYVVVARSVDYTGPQSQEPISDAIVLLNVDGEQFELAEAEKGKYQLPPDLVLQTDKSYTLDVIVDESRYQANSMMFQCPDILDADCALVKDSIDSYVVNFTFEDPADDENYYYMIDYKKASTDNDT